MTAINQFKGRPISRLGSPTHLAEVTPDDGADLAQVAQIVYVATPGSLRVTTVGGETLTTPTLLPGWHPMEITRIHATGTTAAGLMVGW